MEYDISKLKYDLALAYAKSMLDHALSTNSVPESCDPSDPHTSAELEYLTNMFYSAIDEFANYDDSMFPDKSDF